MVSPHSFTKEIRNNHCTFQLRLLTINIAIDIKIDVEIDIEIRPGISHEETVIPFQ